MKSRIYWFMVALAVITLMLPVCGQMEQYPLTDTDGDTIPDYLEVNGYYYDAGNGTFALKPADVPDPYFITYHYTDWLHQSSDFDPYNDNNETTGANMDPLANVDGGDDPIVAAYPKMSIVLDKTQINPQRDIIISGTKKKSSQDSWANTFESKFTQSEGYGLQVGVKGGGGKKLGLFGSFIINQNLEYQTTSTSRTSTSGVNSDEWSQAYSENPDKIATIFFHVHLENHGNGAAKGVNTQFNVNLGSEHLATVNISSTEQDIIKPGGRFPSSGEIVIEKDTYGQDMYLSLDNLRSIETGVPLTIVPLSDSFDCHVTRYNADTQQYDDIGSWSEWYERIQKSCAFIQVYTTSGSHECRVFTAENTLGSQYRMHTLTLGEAILRTCGELQGDDIYIDGEKVDENWRYYVSNMTAVNETVEANLTVLDIPLYRGSGTNNPDQIIIKSPDADMPLPVVKWANFNPETLILQAIAAPGSYQIASMHAEITLPSQGQPLQVDLIQAAPDDPTFSANLSAFMNPQDAYALAGNVTASDVMNILSDPFPVAISAVNPEDYLGYVPFPKPEHLISYSWLDTNEQYIIIDNNNPFPPDSGAYVLLVTSERFSSNLLEVVIEGIKVDLACSDWTCGGGTGDCSWKPGAHYSPTHSHMIIVPRPADGRNYLKVQNNFGSEHRSQYNGKDYDNPQVSISALGYFRKSGQGDKFTWEYRQLNILNRDKDGNIVAATPNLDTGIDPQTAQNISAYAIIVESDQFSSDQNTITINGIPTELGSSDAHTAAFHCCGHYPGADKSPLHAHLLFVPAEKTHPNLLSLSAGHNTTYKWWEQKGTAVKTYLLGYFSPNGTSYYSSMYKNKTWKTGDQGINMMINVNTSDIGGAGLYLIHLSAAATSSDQLQITNSGTSPAFSYLFGQLGTSATCGGCENNVYCNRIGQTWSTMPRHGHLGFGFADIEGSDEGEFPIRLNVNRNQWPMQWQEGNYLIEVLGYFTDSTPGPNAGSVDASFMADTRSGYAPLTVSFRDATIEPVTQWQWDFGDGSTSDQRHPVHTYTQPGNYTVSLTTENDLASDVESIESYITVLAPDFSLELEPGWNFISVPRRLDEGVDTDVIFGNLTGVMLRYDTKTQHWEQLHSISAIQPLDGIWIRIEEQVTIPLVFDPEPVLIPPAKQLYPGWNAIGFTDLEPLPAKTVMLPVHGIWTFLFSFNAEEQKYNTSIINGGTGSHRDSQLMYPGQGYWLFATDEGILPAIGA
jgi:hypothetical protein